MTTDIAPSVPRHRGGSAAVAALAVLGGLLALAWLAALAASPDALPRLGLALNAHGHAHLHPHGHPFIDARTLLGVPNGMDVLTNLPLLLAGAWGLALWRRAPGGARQPGLALFFAGLVLTAWGSAFYHWAPDPRGLMLDRLGMAVAFAGMLVLAWHERAGATAGAVPWCLLAAAALSAVLPYTHDQLLPWVVLQFGGFAFVLAAAACRPAPGALGVRLGAVAALYALAKGLEVSDQTVFEATGGLISGHSAKHLAAALAAWPVLVALRTYSRP